MDPVGMGFPATVDSGNSRHMLGSGAARRSNGKRDKRAKRKRDSAQPQERTKSRVTMILAAVVVLLCLSVPTQAQQSSPRNQALKIDVELALVTATVTDPSGRIWVSKNCEAGRIQRKPCLSLPMGKTTIAGTRLQT